MESTPSCWDSNGFIRNRKISGSFAHAIQEHLETVNRIGEGVKVSYSVCANGVPSATATTEEDFTKRFLRADLLDA